MKKITYAGLIAVVVVFAVEVGDEDGHVARAGTRSFTTLNCDSNGDAKRDISDAVYILSWLFGSGEGPVELRADGLPTVLLNGDCNGDDGRNLSDAISLLNWLFAGGEGSRPVCPSTVIDAAGNIEEVRGDSSDCPRGAPEPEFTPEKLDPTEGWTIPDSRVGVLVSQHFETIHSVGPEVEVKFKATLNALREEGPEVIELLAVTYKRIEKEFYGLRWALIQTLADLQLDDAMSVLVEVANDPVDTPVPQDSLIDTISTYDEELVLRLTAIQGLGHLAAEPSRNRNGMKDRTAASHLGRLVNHPERAVSEEALRGIAEAIRRNPADSEDREYPLFLHSLLPKSFVFIFDLSDILPIPPIDANPSLKPDGVGNGSQPQN